MLRKLRFTSLALGLLGLAPAAMASYELLMIPAADKTIRRIDPISGVSLGSLGTPAGTKFIQADKSSGVAYVYAQNSIFRQYYSTGERLNTYNVGNATDIALSPDGSTLLVMNGTTISRRNALTGSVISTQTLTAPYGTAASLTYLSPTLLGVGSRWMPGSFEYPVASSADASTLASIGAFGAGSGRNSPVTIGKVGFASLADGRSRVLVPGRFSDGGIIFGNTVFNSAGINVSAFSFTVFGFSTDSTKQLAVVPSHSGFYVIGADPANNTRVLELDGETLVVLSERTYGFALPDGRFAPSIVVAPEPGTMIALGLGLAGIVARRRRRG